MEKLLSKLQKAYPDVSFEPGSVFYWSPVHSKVTYRQDAEDTQIAAWSLLHEVGHALLEHQTYETDFQLLKLEVAAWEKAKELAENYDIVITEDHIQDCLDTYREWLYQRSTCPSCLNCNLQTDSRTYQCFNCGTVWHVSSSRMCRPYRRKQKGALVS